MKTSPITRINLSIVLLCVAVIQAASAVGLLPDERVAKLEYRDTQCRLVATQLTDLIARQERRKADKTLQRFATLNNDLISVGIRRNQGELWASTGDHQTRWQNRKTQNDDGCYQIPILERNREWGRVEFNFKPIYAGHNRYTSDTNLRVTILVALTTGLICGLQLTRVLRYLDPRRAVPGRVTEALDNFAEGVVVLDKQNRIMLANHAFTKFVDRPTELLQGTNIWNFSWSKGEDRQTVQIDPGSMSETPWPNGRTLWHLSDTGGRRQAIFSVNASSIVDDAGAACGSMLAFADITALEQSRQSLRATLNELEKSRAEIVEQNKTLKFLATHDPLTNCVNRRTFFEALDGHWQEAKHSGGMLSVLMVDIDFFKSINDNHGHAKGDEVLRTVGGLLSSACHDLEMASRFGGEEFSILLPGVALEQAAVRAEEIRRLIEDLTFGELKITASLGVSAFSLGAEEPNAMLEQADQCLYYAKRHGRNQVARFDQLPPDFSLEKEPIARESLRQPTPPALMATAAAPLAQTPVASMTERPPALDNLRDWMKSYVQGKIGAQSPDRELQDWQCLVQQLQELTDFARSLESRTIQVRTDA